MSAAAVVILIGAVAMTLAAGGCVILAAIDSRKPCRCERCRAKDAGLSERSMCRGPQLDRVWERVGEKVRRGQSARGQRPRLQVIDDGRGAA